MSAPRSAARRRTSRRGAALALGSAVLVGLVVFAAFRLFPPFAAAEARARDVVHTLFFPAAPTRDDVVLVLIEEATLARLPYRSPIDRGFLAELLASLLALEPRAVALDLLLDQPTEAEKDADLFALLRAEDGPPVVVAVADEADGLTEAQAAFLADATWGARIGQAALLFDPDNDVVRAVPPRREVFGRSVPALSVALAEAGGAAAPDGGFDVAFAPPEAAGEFAPRLVAGFHPYFNAA
ncbi:MAG: CHASE2 domain-containing protein, partial [Pseudomonadota bacterium]